ncbi:hypothetical protein HC891_15570 [Candidatus Gracilibacteria bacterium]|nr:hypothetical protein [Candidatus Gracilibacteria bacterium]
MAHASKRACAARSAQPGARAQLFVAAARWVASTEPGWPLHLWVFAANADARRFYQRMGGVVVEQSDKAMPGGVTRSLLRYLWCDLSGF